MVQSKTLRRDVIEDMEHWKAEKDRKCLLVRGARQVGKTYAVEHFGRKAYSSFIEINFLESPDMKKIFYGNLDVKTILMNISLYLPESSIVPGETCLFLDEIQECPEAITALKFLAQDERFDVIASGSMLGIDYKRPTSYPVGSVHYIDMHAMSFKEFLYSQGIKDEIIEVLRGCFADKTTVPWAVHDKLMELFRQYIVIGGMPEVVSIYNRQNSVADADRKIRDILNDYRYDIAHYAEADAKIKAEACYFSIAGQLSKENHKFMYSSVEKGGNARKYKSSIDWLKGAYLVKLVHNITGYDSPLGSRSIEDNFRVYTTDIGILTGMYDYSVKEQILKSGDDRMNGMLKGALYEAAIADVLMKNGHEGLFFKKNETATFEMEFMIENTDGVIPIEVKSGRSKSKSLDNLLKREEIPYGYKLVDGNVGVAGKKITLPLYMAMFI